MVTAISPRQEPNGLLIQVVAALDSCFCLIRPRRHRHVAWLTAVIGLRALCSLPFTTKTGAKHPFIKAPAPHDTCGSCWLCIRHSLTDYGFMLECRFLLLYVNSFQLVTKEKNFFKHITQTVVIYF